jgi:hemolysin activation/secretion protein
MSKKLILLGFTAIALVDISAADYAMADTRPVAGIADRRADIPYLEDQIKQRQQPAKIEVPHADDYRGTNTPLPPISAVTFNGPTVLSEEDLNTLAAPYLDRPLTDNDIAQLKNAIADEYTKRGYPLIKVATPTQDLTDGELTINIYEGRIGQIIPQTGGVIHDYVPLAFSQRLKGEVFSTDEAESVINDLNEINNTISSITLKPGIEPLTTDLVLNVQPGGLKDVNYIAADNYGNDLTGKYVGSLHLEKTNMLAAGEKLTFDGRVSDEKLYAAGVGIRIPTGFRNTFFEASYLYSHNDIVDRLEFLDASGKSHIFNIGFTGNVINRDDSKLTLRAGMDAREHESFLSGVTDTHDHIRRAYVGATYLGLYPEDSTAVLVDAKLSKGVGILGASEEGDNNITRASADPEAVMFEPSLFIRHDLTPDDMLTFYTRGQLSTNTLLSSDTFILGGYGSVRGFQPAQEVGDAGFTFSGEYQHKFPVPIGENSTIGVGPWVDGGHVYNRLSNQTLDNSLFAAGLGVELAADLVPVGPTKVRLDWAHPLGNYNSDQVDKNSFYFRVQQDF